MNFKNSYYVMGGALFLLGACTGNLDFEDVGKMKSKGTAFHSALQMEYVDLAASEFAESDLGDMMFFTQRAQMAVDAKNFGPQALGGRALPEDKVGELMDARRRLTMALSTGASERNPTEAARAQVMFDCWMQEQEENFQPEDIARCRGATLAALDLLEVKPVAMAAPKLAPVPGPYVVFFDTDSFELNEKSLAIIKEAAGSATAAKVMKAVLGGYTDTVGSDDYNKGLSRARVIAVGNALMEAGVSRKLVQKDFYGESKLRVATPDNTANQDNRRVEINFDR